MGTVSSTFAQLNKMDSNWQVVEATKMGTNIVQDPNGRKAEEFTVKYHGLVNVNQQMRIYNYRRTQDVGFVKVYCAILVQEATKFSCGSSTIFKVVTEYLPHRLHEIILLTWPQALYLLTQSLRIFRQLYLRVGPMTIEDELFAFTEEGRLRIWCHPNFGVNTCGRPIDNKNQANEAIMVGRILELIQRRCENEFPPAFNLMYNSKPYMDFNMAQLLVKEFIEQNLMRVPGQIDVTKKVIIDGNTKTYISKQPDTILTQIKTTIYRYGIPKEILNFTPQYHILPDIPATSSITNEMLTTNGGKSRVQMYKM